MNLARKMSRQPATHNVIAATAMEIAGCAYEVLALGSDVWYRANPDINAFIQRRWGTFVEEARSRLVDVLTDPNTHDNLKQAVFEALQHDGALNPPRIHAERAVGLHEAIEAQNKARESLH